MSQYQTVKKKSLPKPVWSLHCPVSSSRWCRGSGLRPPCQSVQLSAQTIAAPGGEKKKFSQRVAFCCCLLKIVNFVSSVHMIVYSVNRSSDGWAALKLRGPCRYVFCTQAEIVVGGLHSQRSSSLPCFLNQFQWLCRRQVNYVAANPGAGIL